VSDSLDSPVARNNTLVHSLTQSNMLSVLDLEGTGIAMPDDIAMPDASNATQTSSLQIPVGMRFAPSSIARSLGVPWVICSICLVCVGVLSHARVTGIARLSAGTKVACLSHSTLRDCLRHVQNLQWAWRADRLNALDIARPLTYEQRLEIAKAMKVRSFKAGDVICEAGDHSVPFSVLQRGKVVLECSSHSVRVFSKGDIIGERAHPMVRGSTVPPMSHPHNALAPCLSAEKRCAPFCT
jgi:hypothetical protein